MALACTATERHTFNIDTDLPVITTQEIQATILLARFVGGTPWTGLIVVATNSEPSRDAVVTRQAARENFGAVALAKSIWQICAHAFCYAETNVSPTWADLSSDPWTPTAVADRVHLLVSSPATSAFPK
jgi:hypothetical protein